MIKSMTGYGRFEASERDYRVSVEIKSVNHKYCDINIKMPARFGEFENDIRKTAKQYAERGKIDVYVSFEDYSESRTLVRYRSDVARGYMDAISAAADEFGVKPLAEATSLLMFPGVVSLEEAPEDTGRIFGIVDASLRKACEMFARSREKEGAVLRDDILRKLDRVLELVGEIELRSPQIVGEYRKRLSSKVLELLGDRKIDDGVLATEIAIFADKLCVDEETVRLRSHAKNMRETLDAGESVGRKLDFIAQEMNREANTILSKAGDMSVSETAIELKTEVEKIREQVQNIE